MLLEELNGNLAELAQTHPPGVVAVSCGDLARFHQFTMAISSLEYPLGTRIHIVQSVSIAANFNIMVNQMAPEHEWCWIQADDQVFQPDALLKMLSRDVDVLVPLISRRHPPFSSLVFKEETEDGFRAYGWGELPTEGLFGPVYGAGSGGMLVRRSVFERMREWQGHDLFFEFSAGQIVNEDTEFCRKLREMDIPIYVDCDVTMGHCGTFVAWPQPRDGKWGMQFQMGEGEAGTVQGIFIAPEETDA